MGITSGNDNKYVAFEKESLIEKFGDEFVKQTEYRTFDKRYINYNHDLLARSRSDFMNNLNQQNFAICSVRRSRSNSFVTPFIVKGIVDKSIISTLDNANIFPIYWYSKRNDQQTLEKSTARTPNLNLSLLKRIEEKLELTFVPE